jgi:hypothetical protein
MISVIKKINVFYVGCHELTPKIEILMSVISSGKKTIFKNKKYLEPRYTHEPQIRA